MIGKKMMMNDPRYIPPSDRNYALECINASPIGERSLADVHARKMLLDHATFMDERDARQRDLIRRLAEELDYRRGVNGCDDADDDCATCKLVAEARGVEATNE